MEKLRKYNRIKGNGSIEEFLLDEATDFEQFHYNLGSLVAFNSLTYAMGFPQQKYFDGDTVL